ncbi:MAG: nitroreductase, partial [Clostridiales bacterium]|nr:nitroreductase [Clostridiales bacterium]
DCSIAMAYIILKAHTLGLGTCWLGHFDAGKVKKTLDIPDDVNVVAFTPLGYPVEETVPRPRKELNEIVSYDTYQ